METSYANAGEVSPGYSSPWAAPGLPIKALQWLFMRHRPLVIWPMPDPAMIAWGLRLLMNCTSARYELNKSRMVPIAEYSRDLLRELRGRLGLAYDERAQGTLQLFRKPEQLDGTAKDIEVLKRYGVAWEMLDRDGCIAVEPALARVREKFVGGLRLPGDETGDCFKFTGALAAVCRQQGVEFRWGTAIRAHRDRRRPRHRHRHRAAAASPATPMSRPWAATRRGCCVRSACGCRSTRSRATRSPCRSPIRPARPESTVMDETHKVAITRLGDRIRVGGTAELAGYSTRCASARRGTLEHVVSDLYPDGGDVARAEFWCGLRPMTPDGPPIIGPTSYPTFGSTPATARSAGPWPAAPAACSPTSSPAATPAIDVAGLGLARYA